MLRGLAPIATLLVVAIALVLPATAPADTDSAGVDVTEWLVLGPMTAPLPAFNNEDDSEKVDAGKLLGYPHLDVRDLRPEEGREVPMAGAWATAAAGTSGVSFETGETAPGVAYMAAFVAVPRWMKVDFAVRSTQPFELFVDGESVVEQTGGAKPDADAKTGTAALAQGTHTLVVKGVYVPGDSAEAWNVRVSVSPAEEFDAAPTVSRDPARPMSIHDVLDGPFPGGVSVSPDGKLVRVSMTRRVPPEGTTDRWMEIRRVKGGELVRTLRDLDGSRWTWAPTGNRLSYTTTSDSKTTLRVLDLDTDRIDVIVEDVADFVGYNWSPDGTYVIYSVRVEPEEGKTGLVRFRGLSDRRRGDRNRNHLYLASVPAGVTRRLTAGKHGAFLHDIHPDARQLLIGRSWEDLEDRPYSETQVLLLDLRDLTTTELWKGSWVRSAQFSPDGETILATGGPSSFGGVGANVPDGVIPNDYDVQAFLFDLDTKSVDPITKDFDPTIQSAWWPKDGNDIYFAAGAGEFVTLYRYNVKKREFKEIELESDVLHARGVARDKPVAVVVGSGANEPPRVFAVDLKRGKARTFLDPLAERFEEVRIGEVKDFDFTSLDGTTIVGRVHYPPNFTPEREWPAIVYYYGGTSPVTRSFGGRYPKNLWAAHGYVVYVLQPSGATGFGQEFSARHVNDWGKTTSKEIVEGTRAFLDAHPFVDRERVGCIGASYGGFMTMLLVTQTDIFAAAISHAGISSLSSYWGEGYWGYGYSAVATANSFPWNRPDIYVEQSPLFNADNVTTPLLLLHGDSDTNVPRGESDQMYAALKLLGKEVEYIRVEGTDHWVLDYKKRVAWSNAIVSWFDRWLKGEPEWWNEQFPPLEKTEEHEPETMGVHEVELEKYGKVLLGEVTRDDIRERLPAWDREYMEYTPDDDVLAQLNALIDVADITVVLGTWCSDSKREVPRFWKILDTIDYPVEFVRMYAVGSSKFTDDMPIPDDVFRWSNTVKNWYDVSLMSTFIISRGGKEIGRIVETPDGSLEDDLLEILKKS